MKILGITGGVGSGKSRILYDLEHIYGAYIVEADKVAHELMQPDNDIYIKIVDTFGKSILSEEYPYEIDRKKLGDIVFNNETKLLALNNITHPMVKNAIKNKISEIRNAGEHKLFVIEAALLIQDNYSEICDEIWYIWVSREERIKRLAAQRGYSEEKTISIFESQETDDYYKKYANYTINNNLGYDFSTKQLKERLNIFLADDIID